MKVFRIQSVLVLTNLISSVRGETEVLKNNALAITIALSALSCVVMLVCTCVVTCLLVKLVQLRSRVNHLLQDRRNSGILHVGYKRVSNVYDVVEIDNISRTPTPKSENSANSKSPGPSHQDLSSACRRILDKNLDASYQALSAQSCELELDNGSDDGIYQVMTSPRADWKEKEVCEGGEALDSQ